MSFKRVGSFLLLAVTFLLLAIADARKGSFERQGERWVALLAGYRTGGHTIRRDPSADRLCQGNSLTAVVLLLRPPTHTVTGNTEDFDVQSAKQTVLDTVLDKTKQELDGHNSAWTDKPTGDSSGNDSGDDSDKASPWQGNIKQALQGIGKHFKPDQDSQGNKPDYPADKEGTSEFPWGNKPQKSGPQQDDASQQPHAGADTGAASSGGDNVSDAGDDCWGPLLPGQFACSKPTLRPQVGWLAACTRRATPLKLLACCDCLLQS